jgi:replicative DNA helicase Mcm
VKLELISIRNFLEEVYKTDCLVKCQKGEYWLDIDFRKVQEFDIDLAEYILTDFEEAIKGFEIEVNDICEVKDEKKGISVHISNLGSSIKKDMWAIRAEEISKVITIQGKITQIGEIFNRIFIAKYECPSCGQIVNSYSDISDLDHQIKEPSRCVCGKKGKLRPIQEFHKDFMKIILTEDTKNKEEESIMCLLSGNLCRIGLINTVALNRKVEVVGVIKLKQKAKEEANLIKFVYVNSIRLVDDNITNYSYTPKDITEFEEISKSETLFEDMAQSIHPNISGQDTIKLATLLQLVGGVPIYRNNKLEERGVIHILLASSPGMGKSYMMSNVIQFLPNANQAEGRATSGAGLVCAAVKDEEIGYSVSAGKVALATGSITAIDEMDKIRKEDLAYLNTAMVNMRINFDKGGLHLTLETETAILGACNPKNKVFDDYSKKGSQIGIEQDLLDRFDLVFPIFPPKEEESRKKIVDLIINKYEVQPSLSSPIYPFTFMVKYINYIRKTIKPRLPEEVREYLSQRYMELARPESIDGTSYFSYRLLTNIIRMAQASAKIRLSSTVDVQDIQRAFGLLIESLKAQEAITSNGRINYEKVEHVPSKEKRDMIHEIRETIKELCEQSEEHLAEINMILTRMLAKGFSDEKIEEAFENMKRAGEILSPRVNRYVLAG